MDLKNLTCLCIVENFKNHELPWKFCKSRQKEAENIEYNCNDYDYKTDCVHCFTDHDHELEQR